MRVRGLVDASLGTLASKTAVLFGTKIDSSRLQGCRDLDVFYGIHLQGKTAGPNEGPIWVGMCTDVVIADIAAWFDADPQSAHDEVEIMRSKHRIQALAYLPQSQTTSGSAIVPTDVLPRKKRFFWDVIEGTTFDFFAFNANGADPLTTGGTLQIPHEILGEWRDD